MISGLEYIGPKELTQYFIKDTNMAFGLNNDITVTVVLGRLLLLIRPVESHVAQLQAEQGPCEPSKDFVSKFGEQ